MKYLLLVLAFACVAGCGQGSGTVDIDVGKPGGGNGGGSDKPCPTEKPLNKILAEVTIDGSFKKKLVVYYRGKDKDRLIFNECSKDFYPMDQFKSEAKRVGKEKLNIDITFVKDSNLPDKFVLVAYIFDSCNSTNPDEVLISRSVSWTDDFPSGASCASRKLGKL